MQFVAWHTDDNYIYIAMEFIELGDLGRYIDFQWAEADTKVVASQLLAGLRFMHEKEITHRDLKPANIFPILLNDGSLRIKIGDFGVSKRVSVDSSTVLLTRVGTCEYTAPEVFVERHVAT